MWKPRLLRASVSFVSENAARYFETGHVPRRKHRTTTAGVFAFEDQDGLPFVLHMSSPDKFWLGACSRSSANPSGRRTPRFNNRKARIENYDALVEAADADLSQRQARGLAAPA